jgi:RimJ/RimL family protein N-acetyltransferase
MAGGAAVLRPMSGDEYAAWRPDSLRRYAAEKARALGCRELALHVFGHNLQARRLYAKLGYAETNVNMSKPLAVA